MPCVMWTIVIFTICTGSDPARGGQDTSIKLFLADNLGVNFFHGPSPCDGKRRAVTHKMDDEGLHNISREIPEAAKV